MKGGASALEGQGGQFTDTPETRRVERPSGATSCGHVRVAQFRRRLYLSTSAGGAQPLTKHEPRSKQLEVRPWMRGEKARETRADRRVRPRWARSREELLREALESLKAASIGARRGVVEEEHTSP